MEQFMKEKFDYKRFFLLNIKRIWIVFLGMALGAVIFAGSYYVKRVVLKNPDIYRVDGLYNIEFDMELYNDTIQYYNDYTWNDVIDSDVIGGTVADRLGINKDIVYSSTFVPTMSDIRIIHVYVDNDDAELAQQIQEEIRKALEEFGTNTPGFISVKNWSISEPIVVEKDFLIKRVAFIGILLGMVVGALYMKYINAMDDSVYTLKDAESFTGIIPAGYDIDSNISCILKGVVNNNTQAITLYETVADFSVINSILETCGMQELYTGMHDEAFYKKLENTDSVVAVVEYGKNDGMLINSEIEKLKLLGVNIATVIIANADAKFVKAYYRGK